MKGLPSEIGREISLSSEGNLKEIEEDSLRALRGMQGIERDSLYNLLEIEEMSL